MGFNAGREARQAAPPVVRRPFALEHGEGHRLDGRELREERVDLERAREAFLHPRIGAQEVISSPPRNTWPESGRSIPVSRFMSVVLPAPFGPMSA